MTLRRLRHLTPLPFGSRCGSRPKSTDNRFLRNCFVVKQHQRRSVIIEQRLEIIAHDAILMESPAAEGHIHDDRRNVTDTNRASRIFFSAGTHYFQSRGDFLSFRFVFINLYQIFRFMRTKYNVMYKYITLHESNVIY